MSFTVTGSSFSHTDSDELPDIDEPTSDFLSERTRQKQSPGSGAHRNMNKRKLPSFGQSNQSNSDNMEMPVFGAASHAKSPTAAQGPESSNVVVLSSDSDEEIPACQRSEAPTFATPNPSDDKMTYQDFVLRYMDKEGFLTVTAVRDLLNGISKRLSQASAETFSLTLLSMDEQRWAQDFLAFNGYDRGAVKQYWDCVLVHRLKHESREMLSPVLLENSRICLEALRHVANIYSDSAATNREKYFTHVPSFESESRRRKSSSSSDSCPTPRKTPVFTATGNNSESSFDEFNSSSSRGTPSRNGGRSVLPKTYHHSGNTKQFYQNQRHFEITEDLHIARSVLQLSMELNREGQTSDAILDFIRSDNWDFRTKNHQSLKDRVNELNSTNGHGKRSGTSLKGRWKKIVSYITSGNEQLPFLKDASIDAEGFKKIINRYHYVAVNSRANRKSASGN